MKLKELGEYFIGLTYKPENISDKGIIVLRSGNIQDGQFDLSDIVRVDTVIREKQFVKPGDILMCSRNGSARLVGKSTVIPVINEPMTFGAFMTIFRTPYNDYLKFFLQSSSFRKQLSGSKTTTINQITIRMLDNIDMDLPGHVERKKRIEKLETLQKIIGLRKKELGKLDDIIKARFVELFGDPVLNEKGWDVRSFLDMGDCKNGMNFHYDDSGVELNCLGVGDFKDNSIIDNTSVLPMVSLNEMPSDEYLLRDDDIVFVRSNGNKALVGRSVAVYPGTIPTIFSGFCIRYRKHDENITIPYLLRVLKTDSIRKKMAGRGANIQNLNQKILGELVIPIPPLDLQKQFSDFVTQVDKSKIEVQKSLDEAQILFDSLMQQYFG